MIDPMESFKRAVRPVRGALHTVMSQREFDMMVQTHHEGWTQANPDLGLPLHLVRAAEAEAHRGSRRVGPPARRSWLRRIMRFLCSRS
jgi:hypothetical protein